MELRSLNGLPKLRLIVRGYLFPNLDALTDDPHDANWLLVKIHIETTEFRGTVVEPCLLTWESEALLGWLLRVAEHAPLPTSEVDYGSRSAGAITFVEPNIAFCVESYPSDSSVVLRVLTSFVPLEPATLGESQDGIYGSHIDIEVSNGALVEAATSLAEDLRRFPARG